VAESAGLVSIDRKLLIKQQQFTEQLDLLHLVRRGSCNPLQSFGLNSIDLRLHAANLTQRCRRKGCVLLGGEQQGVPGKRNQRSKKAG
jgi:hypothetical protein